MNIYRTISTVCLLMFVFSTIYNLHNHAICCLLFSILSEIRLLGEKL